RRPFRQTNRDHFPSDCRWSSSIGSACDGRGVGPDSLRDSSRRSRQTRQWARYSPGEAGVESMPLHEPDPTHQRLSLRSIDLHSKTTDAPENSRIPRRPKSTFASCGATAFDIFRRGVSPVEPDMGESHASGTRMHGSDVFEI